ncbi:MAG: hypothetical protein H8E42_00175 [Nitrospinae bacterium]|nr:hypothetical protein [Nitrospinota bacterium]
MATIKFRHFIQPDVIMSIDAVRLLSLLAPYKEYFVRRGLVFPEAPQTFIDCTKLSTILADPDEQVPSQMVEALYFISAIANSKAMDGLVAAAKAAHPEMVFDMNASDTDIVVQVWLEDPGLVAKNHAASLINKPKSFEYHLNREHRPQTFLMPSPEKIQAIENTMSNWFGKNRRGRNCRILTADHGNKISFLIRHGKPMQRHTAIKNEESETICYRPEVFDVVFYDRSQNELGIRTAGTKGERNLYRETLGFHLFDYYDYFNEQRKFTLNPLEMDGIHSLVCSDIDGLEQVTLTAIKNSLDEGCNGHDLHTANDIFLSLLKQNRSMPPASAMTMAVFSMKLSGVKNPRSLTIRPPNCVMYHRDEDSIVIDQWLSKRGFINSMDR